MFVQIVQAITDYFRGPGPFWTSDGAAVQKGETSVTKANDPWIAEEARDDEALAARCVREVDPEAAPDAAPE